MGHLAMEMKKAEDETKREGDGKVEGELAEPDAPIAPAQTEVEADTGKTTDGEKGVESGVEEDEFAEER